MKRTAAPRLPTTDDERLLSSAAFAVASAAAGNADPQAVARVAARQLGRILQPHAIAMLLRSTPDRLVIAATAGPGAATARHHWSGGLAVAAGLPCPGALPALPHGVCWTLIPLRRRRQLVGVIAVAAADARVPYLARRFATRVVRPLHRCLLAAELHAASLAAAQSVDLDGTLRAILAGVRRVVPADAASVLVREGDHARVVAVDGHPPEALGHLLRISQDVSLEGPLLRGEAVRLDHLHCDYDDAPAGADQIRGYLGAPLLCGDDVVGILCVDSWVVGAFDDEDLQNACRFAVHTGTALARARAHARTLAESVALREAAVLATLDPSADDIVARMLDGLCRVVACDGASVLLREGAYAYIAAVHGHPAILGDRFRIEGNATLEIPLVQGRPFVTVDLSAEPSFDAGGTTMTVRGHLAVPLRARGEVLGLLAVDSQQRGAFGVEDAARVELFAGYVAAALQNARLHDAVRRASQTDSVTGLLNHGAIHARLDAALAAAQAGGQPLAVAMLDLDGFKLYNDTHGHPAGDAALRAVAQALTDAVRANTGDVVGRYGGDEFLAVLPGLTPHEAATLGRRLRNAVGAHIQRPPATRVRAGEEGGPALPLRVSVGIACFPGDGENRDALVARADARLYESKGRGEVRSSDDEADDAGVAEALGALGGLVRAVDRKDRYTYAHSTEVTRLAVRLGLAVGLGPSDLRAVRTAGLLHDVGKIGVADRVLKKPGRLSPQEREAMQAHPALGDAIVAGLPLDGLQAIRAGVRHHHERWDGGGYPDGLAGEAIPLLGRLLALPDCYNAMTSDRPYRAALSSAAALAEIERGAGTQFDPALAAAFLELMRQEEAGALGAEAPDRCPVCGDDLHAEDADALDAPSYRRHVA